MDRTPLAKAKSKWEQVETPQSLKETFMPFGAVDITVHRRPVGDGWLSVVITHHERWGYQLSIDFTDHRGKLSRYPRWDEIADARYTLLPDDLDMCMRLPPPSEYVALHKTTFQLIEHGRPDGKSQESASDVEGPAPGIEGPAPPVPPRAGLGVEA